MMPIQSRPVTCVRNPNSTSGNQSCEAKPVAGTSAPRKRKPASWWASWNACPVSWAATATAATELELPTGADRRMTLPRGS